MMDTLTWPLLDRYFSGACSPDEHARIESWVQGEPERVRYLDSVRQIWEMSGRGVYPGEEMADRFDAREALRTVRGRMAVQNDGHVLPVVSRASRQVPLVGAKFSTLVYRAVVGVVACTLAVFAGWRLHESKGDRSDATLWSTYSTANGQRATITLPDGSIVALNVGSRIQVPTDYASGNRALHLTGEALFTVVPSEASPFTVVAGPSTTRVLGTSFVVRHYPTDTVATIAVQHGKVMVDSTVVVAAQQLSVGWNSRSVVRPVNAAPFSFVAGVLTLDETPLAEAISVLSRWYDIEIRLADSALATRRITGDFGAGSSAHFTSIVLGAFNDIGVTQDGRILTLFQR